MLGQSRTKPHVDLTRTQNNDADTRHGKELPLQNERFAVRKYLGELQQFSPLVPPIPLAALRSLHVAQDYKGMVRLTKQVMNVEVSLRIVWVPEGAAETGATKGAPAWISVPKEMPAYGTKAFKDMRLDLYLRTVSQRPGLTPELAVRADVEIPERRMTVTWSLRRNTDKGLPASHTIEFTFNLPADFPGGGIANVKMPVDRSEHVAACHRPGEHFLANPARPVSLAE
jgi:hypothetical protein